MSHFERCVIAVDSRGCSNGTAPSRAPAGPVPLPSPSGQCRVQARWQMDLFQLTLIGSKRPMVTLWMVLVELKSLIPVLEQLCMLQIIGFFFPIISVLPFPPKMNRCLKTEDLSIKKK